MEAAVVDIRRARLCTTAVFFVTGAVFASWAARIPAVQERLGLSAGALAVALLGLNAGAVPGLQIGGAAASRIGSRRALRLGFLVYPPALFGVAIAPDLGWLVATLAVMAAANGVIDVAMNAQGIELERRHGRPLLSSLHAGHSFGVLGGGLAGTGAAAAGVSLAAHFGVAAAVGVAVALLATGALVDEELDGSAPRFARPSGRLALLGLIVFLAFFAEGAANDWSAVQLRTELDAGFGLAAAAFTTFSLMLALGRLAADRLTARLGRERLVSRAALLAAAGAAVVVAAPEAAAALAGWALLGAGLAGIAPVVLGAAPSATPASAAAAVAAVSTVGYLGSFVGPPLIGGLAELVGLTEALGLLALAGVLMAALARRALN